MAKRFTVYTLFCRHKFRILRQVSTANIDSNKLAKIILVKHIPLIVKILTLRVLHFNKSNPLLLTNTKDWRNLHHHQNFNHHSYKHDRERERERERQRDRERRKTNTQIQKQRRHYLRPSCDAGIGKSAPQFFNNSLLLPM